VKCSLYAFEYQLVFDLSGPCKHFSFGSWIREGRFVKDGRRMTQFDFMMWRLHLQADKGVRCPFCRQVIESYLDSPPARRSPNSPFPPESSSFTLIIGGNAEQASKAVAEIKKPYGRGGIVSIGGGNDYIPPSWHFFCSKNGEHSETLPYAFVVVYFGLDWIGATGRFDVIVSWFTL
jgi:hypothetical protein